MKSCIHICLERLSGLLRTRVIMSCIGLYSMVLQPSIAPYIVPIIGLALGVSAIDAYHAGKKSRENGNK